MAVILRSAKELRRAYAGAYLFVSHLTRQKVVFVLTIACIVVDYQHQIDYSSIKMKHRLSFAYKFRRSRDIRNLSLAN